MNKKIVAMLLTGVLLAGVVSGCGSAELTSSSSVGTKYTSSRKVTRNPVKPESISVLVDGTLVTQEDGRDDFEANWEALTGVDLQITQPEHATYYDDVTAIFESGDLPDVVLLSSTYYTKYAAEGYLADIAPYYEGSDLQQRISAAGTSSLIDAIYINGKLFGISPTRGNGCMTYVKQQWLENCGLEVPSTYEEYLNMLDAFTKGDPDGDGIDGNTYGVSAAGIINSEAPYVNYLPEFYQDAYPSFYEAEDGTWVDGFTEDSMKEALGRLQSAYKAGYIDPVIAENSTSDCRDKFYADEYGVFTYWAGTWANSLSDKLREAEKDDRIVAMAPIAEVGDYLERVAPVWCITSACKNPEGVYQYFLETMLDGGEVEAQWAYKPDGSYSKNHIDRLLALVPMTNDPGASKAAPKAEEAFAIFTAHTKPADLPYSTDAFAQYNEQLMTLKTDLINRVVTEDMSIDDAYAEFEAQGGVKMSAAVCESLNAE